jgi:ribosomal-protein-serine acetyltransferase
VDSPPEHLRHAAVTLRRWRATDAELCHGMVTDSLAHLRPWMPWAVNNYGLADATDYVTRCEASWATGTAFQYLILESGIPAGSAGLMARIGPGGLEIGYWVHPGHTGKGVATAAAAPLTDAALMMPGVDRVEIHHDVLNLASERVPAKLGYAHVGTEPAPAERAAGLAPSESGHCKVWRITR